MQSAQHSLELRAKWRRKSELFFDANERPPGKGRTIFTHAATFLCHQHVQVFALENMARHLQRAHRFRIRLAMQSVSRNTAPEYLAAPPDLARVEQNDFSRSHTYKNGESLRRWACFR